MSHRLFGTDGVRGKAGEYPLDHETVARLGAALVRAMRAEGRQLRFIAGRDTRESGEWIERELARGVRAEGAHITTAGVLPTPAVAYVTREMGYDAGLVISASHNPFQDNGIKVFSGRGEKFTETLERQVEAIIADQSWSVGGSADVPVERTDVIDAYIAHARLALPEPQRLGRLRIAIDTANGATTTVAPRLFEELGFDVHLLSASPDGRNINLDCGSTHPENLQRAVVEQACRVGVAFDGDGDRAILVDAEGRVIDGDAVLLMCAPSHEVPGPAARQRHRRDGDEQHRSRDRPARERHRDGPLPGRRQVRDGRDDQARAVARRRAVRAHHLFASISSPATASSPR